MSDHPICPMCGDHTAIAKVAGIIANQSGSSFSSSTSHGTASTPLFDVVVRDRPYDRQNMNVSTSSYSTFSEQMASMLSSQLPTQPTDYRPIYNILYFVSIALVAIQASWTFIIALTLVGVA